LKQPRDPRIALTWLAIEALAVLTALIVFYGLPTELFPFGWRIGLAAAGGIIVARVGTMILKAVVRRNAARKR
jgi:hypothetical protein